MHKREKIYDDKISPLMAEIIQICKEHEIPMHCDFSISEKQNEFCNSTMDFGLYRYKLMYVFAKCFEEDGFNFDKFVINLNKIGGKNESSCMLDKLLGNGEWRNNDE